MTPGRAAFRKARHAVNGCSLDVPQCRLALFDAQPFGPGQFLRGAALFVVHLE
jgi:hypothetical protein